jgi:hypothetical protein
MLAHPVGLLQKVTCRLDRLTQEAQLLLDKRDTIRQPLRPRFGRAGDGGAERNNPRQGGQDQ